MKIRESGMPDEKTWDGFFNPVKILETLGISKKIGDVAEFGCGFGTFTIPAAKTISGKIYAIDIEPKMLEITKNKAKEHKLDNIITIKQDFITNGSSLDVESVDYVMLFNILHGEQPEKLFEESWRILKLNGMMGIIHWNYDPNTARGPPMNIRIKSEQCIDLAKSTGFVNPSRYDLKPYHYGITLKK
jgi:ubiquinone/menaquinone biosynthesis C-methylase UbiE